MLQYEIWPVCYKDPDWGFDTLITEANCTIKYTM